MGEFERIQGMQGESVAVNFEERAVYKWRVSELSDSVRRLNPDRQISISILKKEQSAVFEVADYLAYTISQLREKPDGMRTRWCKPILGNGDCIGVVRL